jgi:VanZ family protein
MSMSADVKSQFRAGAKVCSGAVMVLLVIGALGPESWTPRTALGWQFDHFLGYFVITLFVCFAWPRPFVVGGVLMAAAFLLEGLQAFTPDRTANVVAALCGAGGVLTAVLIAELFIRAWRWHLNSARSVEGGFGSSAPPKP